MSVARGAGAAARPRRRACGRRRRRDVGAVRPGNRLRREMTFRAFAETSMTDALKTRIRHVPDFPKAGILFYDVTTLLRDPDGFRIAIDQLTSPFAGVGIDLVVGIESRGFILGSAVADRLRTGFVPVRKLGKLPAATIRASYALEYGTDSLEMHRDAITPRPRPRRPGFGPSGTTCGHLAGPGAPPSDS